MNKPPFEAFFSGGCAVLISASFQIELSQIGKETSTRGEHDRRVGGERWYL